MSKHISSDKWAEKVIEEVEEKEKETEKNPIDIFDAIDDVFRRGEQAGLCTWIRF